jgi:hypothetical protein
MKERDRLSDLECRSPLTGPHHLCEVHGQPALDCANGRLRQVKQAREMDARSTASARAWQAVANEKIAERDISVAEAARLRAGLERGGARAG